MKELVGRLVDSPELVACLALSPVARSTNENEYISTCLKSTILLLRE